MYSPTKPLLFSFLLLFLIIPAFSQQNVLKGTVIDTAEKKKLLYSIVALIDLADSTLYQSIRTDASGKFELKNIPPGKYTLMISYPRMADYLQDLTITDTSSIDLADVPMVTEAKLLQEVIVTAGVPMRMRGDTLEYTADSFYVSPGSNVAALLKRLPGIEVDRNGKITSQGQEVKRVLVDGEEFFSDDPGLATQYLRADAIDKVQVFDKKSEQSEFSGIDDGRRTKTINLKLKKNRKNGFFGKLSTGSNAKEYYNHEAMGALFNGSRKFSIFGNSTKVSQPRGQQSELYRYVDMDWEMIRDGTEGMGASMGTDFSLLSGSNTGLPSSRMGGAHYSDKWNGGAQKLFTNYRINRVTSEDWNNSRGTIVLPDGTGFNNKSDRKANAYNFGQNGSLSFTTRLDSFSTLKVAVQGGWGNAKNQNSSLAESKNEKGFLVNNSAQRDSGLSNNNKYGTSIRFQRKFRKEGRTLSVQGQQEYGKSISDIFNYSANNYFDPATGQFKNADTLNQLQQTRNTAETYALKATYTDRFSKAVGMQLEYGWKSGQSANVLNTLNAVDGKHIDRVDSLSNDYRFTARTHIAGALFTWNTTKLDFNIGAKAFLTGFSQANNDLDTVVRRNFTNFAPQANATWNITKKFKILAHYAGQTSQPTIDQLQPLRRSNNPLFVQIGNPDLKPAFHHTASFGMTKLDYLKGKSLNVTVNFNFTDNQVVSETSIDAQNRQVSRYVNLDGLPTIGGTIHYMGQLKKLNLIPGANISVNRSGNYVIQNNKKVKRETYLVAAGFTLMHHWEKRLWSRYNGNVMYSVGRSDIAGSVTQRMITHRHDIETTINLPGKFQFNTNCVMNFQPKNRSFNTSLNTVQWDASLEKKFLKNDQLVLKLSVNDIMNNNTGYMRTVDGNNIQESDRFVFKRFGMLTLSWNFSQNL